MIVLLFNLLLLVFWVRLWPSATVLPYYNPYVAWINRVSRMALSRLQALLPQWSQRQAAALVFAVLMVLRALAFHGGWSPGRSLRFGFEEFTVAAGFPQRLGFAAASFGLLLFYLWIAYALLARRSHGGNAWSECLEFLARPLPLWRIGRRWAAIAGLGLAIGVLLGYGAHAWRPGMQALASTDPIRFLLLTAINTLAAAAGLLPVVQTLLIALIIGSWIAMLVPAGNLHDFCREGLDWLLGPFQSVRLTFGGLDLTPLLAVLALAAGHGFILWLLLPLYRAVL